MLYTHDVTYNLSRRNNAHSDIYKKSHTREEGGAHLRISFWYLLMNLKNKYLLRKLLKWANKKKKFLIFIDIIIKISMI